MKITPAFIFDNFFHSKQDVHGFDSPPLSYYGAYLSNCPLTDTPPSPLPSFAPEISPHFPRFGREPIFLVGGRWLCRWRGSEGAKGGGLWGWHTGTYPPPRKHTPEAKKSTLTPNSNSTKNMSYCSHHRPCHKKIIDLERRRPTKKKE